MSTLIGTRSPGRKKPPKKPVEKEEEAAAPKRSHKKKDVPRQKLRVLLRQPDELPGQKRVVAIGDVHGDLGALLACLRMSECVAFAEGEAPRWVAEPGTAMVVLGDVVDRFRSGEEGDGIAREADAATRLVKSLGEMRDEEKRILQLLNDLAEQAEAAGGHLCRLVGNHEYMQADPTDKGFHYASDYSSPFSMGGDGPAFWKRRHDSFASGEMHALVGARAPKVAVKIGPHVFCHGGFNRECIAAAGGANIIALANRAFSERWAGAPEANPEVFDTIVNGCGPARGGTDPFSGILWDDSLSHVEKPEDTCSAEAGLVLRDLNRNLGTAAENAVKHLVISHCIQAYRPIETAGQRPSLRVARADLDATDWTTRGAKEPRFVPSDHANRTINALCGGLVWRLDVGMSRAFAADAGAQREEPWLKSSGRPAILIIDKNQEVLDYTVRQANKALY